MAYGNEDYCKRTCLNNNDCAIYTVYKRRKSGKTSCEMFGLVDLPSWIKYSRNRSECSTYYKLRAGEVVSPDSGMFFFEYLSRPQLS